MDPAVSKAQETKFLYRLRQLATRVMPDGLDSAEQKRWADNFIIYSVREIVNKMSQEPNTSANLQSTCLKT